MITEEMLIRIEYRKSEKRIEIEIERERKKKQGWVSINSR